MIVEWKPDALAELVDHVEDYAKKHDPLTAYRVFDEVIERARMLGDHPDMGRGGRMRGTRELVLTGTPFILVYRQPADTVEILRVLHGAQQWPPGKKMIKGSDQ